MIVKVSEDDMVLYMAPKRKHASTKAEKLYTNIERLVLTKHCFTILS